MLWTDATARALVVYGLDQAIWQLTWAGGPAVGL